jgi:hypothetical protein
MPPYIRERASRGRSLIGMNGGVGPWSNSFAAGARFSAGRVCLSSSRAGAAVLAEYAPIVCTYPASCQICSVVILSRKAGMPCGRPSRIEAKIDTISGP